MTQLCDVMTHVSFGTVAPLSKTHFNSLKWTLLALIALLIMIIESEWEGIMWEVKRTVTPLQLHCCRGTDLADNFHEHFMYNRLPQLRFAFFGTVPVPFGI